jgi:hypothetical protein
MSSCMFSEYNNPEFPKVGTQRAALAHCFVNPNKLLFSCPIVLKFKCAKLFRHVVGWPNKHSLLSEFVNSKCKVGKCGPNADTKFFSQTQRRDVALFKEEFAGPGPDKMRVPSRLKLGSSLQVPVLTPEAEMNKTA